MRPCRLMSAYQGGMDISRNHPNRWDNLENKHWNSMALLAKHVWQGWGRHQKGIQDPVRTLNLGGGSCRDLAVLMIAVLRSRGIAARFVSGYVHLADDDHEDVADGNTQAWVP